MNVRRLGIHLSYLFAHPSRVNLTHPALGSLTHLEMLDDVAHEVPQLLPHIPNLPALTHLLLLYYEIPRDDILAMLVQCPTLQLVLTLWPWRNRKDYEASKGAPVSDMRFVIGRYYTDRDYWAQWEDGARGLPNFWSRGELFLAMKRNGELPGARYWID
ncbi:hypothetical protein C8R46DRAFT_474831 [Mycena filopes]|nr:hypothetical protein C8R46DRAFT_474831 [Mycena filopes]